MGCYRLQTALGNDSRLSGSWGDYMKSGRVVCVASSGVFASAGGGGGQGGSKDVMCRAAPRCPAQGPGQSRRGVAASAHPHLSLKLFLLNNEET